jgi:hypothetical protein
MHVRPETGAEHTAQPLRPAEARRRGEVGDNLLDVPVPAQGVMPPLPGAEAREIFRQRDALGVRQRPQVAVLRSRHIARSLPMRDFAAG